MDDKPVQRRKALSPMVVTPSEKVTDVRPVQAEKATLPMLVTLAGIVMDARPVHPENLQLVAYQSFIIIMVEK